MTELKKFTFDNFVIRNGKIIKPNEKKESIVTEEESFDNVEFAGEVEPDFEEVVEIKTYTQEEIDEAVRQAEEKGYERGYREANSSSEAKISSLLDGMNNRLLQITTDTCKINTDIENQFLEMSNAIVKQLLPQLAEEHAVDIVNKFIADNFNNFKKEAKLSFYIHPDIISSVQENIAKLANANDFEGKISLHKDESLSKSDCRIEWENGGVECSTGGLIKKIGSLIKDNQTNATGEGENG